MTHEPVVIGRETEEFDDYSDLEFCHVHPRNASHHYCGKPREAKAKHPPTPYHGGGICSHCGNPICPRCMLMRSLDRRARGLEP